MHGCTRSSTQPSNHNLAFAGTNSDDHRLQSVKYVRPGMPERSCFTLISVIMFDIMVPWSQTKGWHVPAILRDGHSHINMPSYAHDQALRCSHCTAASLAAGTREHMVWTVKVLFFINHYTGKCVEKLFMAVEIPWVPIISCTGSFTSTQSTFGAENLLSAYSVRHFDMGRSSGL